MPSLYSQHFDGSRSAIKIRNILYKPDAANQILCAILFFRCSEYYMPRLQQAQQQEETNARINKLGRRTRNAERFSTGE
jgi:hypothetical protein